MLETITKISLYVVSASCIIAGFIQIFPSGDAKIGLLLSGMGLLLLEAVSRRN